MKKIWIVSIAFFSSTGIFAQGSAKNVAMENVTATANVAVPADGLVVMEESYNFGKIPQGRPVHHDFIVKNNGTTPVKLANVQASCGCTTPEWDHENSIPPGGSTTIKVGYNAQAEGPFTKAITITYNETASKVITIKGEVWKTPASSAPENSGLNDLKN